LTSTDALQKRKYLILDRDGTIIRLVHHLKDPKLVEFIPGVANALEMLKGLGFRFGIISNQSVIGRGKASIEEVKAVNLRITNYFEKIGIEFDFVLFCPHKPEANCLCRKPNTLLGETAIEEFSIDPGKSYMVGDAISDIEFGSRLGLKSILISAEVPKSESFGISLWAQDMMSAAQVIQGEEAKRINE
jgi:D-glycero-D-manno-heptose 1,7-bisphosphate phosphatase